MKRIKWSERDYAEINRVVKNFNEKIRKVAKRAPEIADIQPQRVKAKEIIKEISTRSELNKKLNELKRYSQKGVEKPKEKMGFRVSKYDYKETKLKLRIRNQKASAKRKKAEEAGIEQTVTKAENLRPKKFTPTTKEEYKVFKKTLEKQLSEKFETEALERYKENYLKRLNEMGKRGEELAKYLKGVNAKKLYNSTVNNVFASITFTYDPIEQDSILDSISEELKNI